MEADIVDLLQRILYSLNRRRVAPWQEIGYFLQPNVITTTVNNVGWSPIAPNNPNRVCLYVNALSSARIAPTNAIGTSYGLPVQPGQPNVEITEARHGNLCTTEWYGVASGSALITAIEVQLREWPHNSTS